MKKCKADKSIKKRKVADPAEEDEEDRRSESSELCEPVDSAMKPSMKKSSKKKAKALEESDGGGGGDFTVEEPQDLNAVSRFRISERMMARLMEKGIAALFPIQAMTFDTVLDGFDLVGRARTGQGKTLAFVLPILESLINGPFKSTRVTGYGRAPSVIVLLPTRELADQVFEDFKFYGQALGLESGCFCGGMPYGPEITKLCRGIDIVIGTPGRIKDHIEKNYIDLRSLKFRVLDEADEMLNLNFSEDIEFILGQVEDANKVQTLLFSATLPIRVKDIASKFLKADKKTVDLVGNEKMKASEDVRHIVIPCSDSGRSRLIPDIIRFYSSGGQTIVFTETKRSASELAGLLPGAQALHGDFGQPQRKDVLDKFKSSKFHVLVATNVAARGLDIKDVQLVIQCEPPKDIDAYIHRSGRTGRAGNTGVAVTLYDPRKSGRISRIERESGVKFERLPPPQPIDIAKSSLANVVESLTLSDCVIPPLFMSAAEELAKSSSLSTTELVAYLLMKQSDYKEVKSRSLLTSMENHVTLILEAGKHQPIRSLSFAYSVLKRFLPEEKVESVKGMTLTADGYGAVFDVQTEDVDAFLTGQGNAANVSLLKTLPNLQDREQSRGFQNGRNGFSRSPGRRGGGRGGFSDRNNRFSGQSGRRGRSFGGGSSW